jgi:hypothetical protein
MRPRTTSAISRFLISTSFSLSMRAELDLALAHDGLELARLLDALRLHGDLALAVLLGHLGTAHASPLRRRASLPRLRAEDHRRFLTSSSFTRCASFCSRAWAIAISLFFLASASAPLLLELEHRLVGGEVLAADLHALLLTELVGLHVLARGDLGDLADALRVEDVLRVERARGGLLEEVDGRVVEHEAVEILADDLDDLVAELSRAPCRGPRSRAACPRS